MPAVPGSSRKKRDRNGLALTLAMVLAMLMTACGGGATDSTNPQVFINSAATSATASYELTGGAFDNTGVTELVYTLEGGAEQALTLNGGQFSATLTLIPGNNTITVTARDAAGNEGAASITVDYQAAPTSDGGHAELAAARGETIQLVGSGFGTDGSVDIGGVPATADDWSDTEITITIPEDAPSGPQVITVHGPYGITTFDVFIGIEFDGDTIDELALLDLPADTAVLLAARTYGQSSYFVVLTSLSLYGQGEGATVIDTGGGVLFFETAVHSTIQDLTIFSDAVIVRGVVPGPIAPLATNPDLLRDLASVLTVDALAAALGGELAAQAGGSRSLTIRDATIAQNLGGSAGFVAVDPFPHPVVPFPGSIHLERATINQPDAHAVLLASGDITVTDSVIEAGAFEFLAPSGGIDIRDSQLSNGTANGPFFMTGLFAQNDITLLRNTISNASEGLAVGPMWLLTGAGAVLPTAADYHVEGNTFVSIDLDPHDSIESGSLMLAQPPGNGRVLHNSFEVQRDTWFMTIGGSLDLRDNEFELGPPAVHGADLILMSTGLPSYLEFAGNDVNWNSPGGLVVHGVHHIVVSDNRFDTYDSYSGGQTALTVLQSADMDLRLDVLDNTFRGFSDALYIEGEGADAGRLTLALNYNVFDSYFSAPGQVARLDDVVEADLDADFNQWGAMTDLATLNGWIIEYGTTTPGILVINEILE